MSFLRRYIRGKCWNCTDKVSGDRNTDPGCEREWALVRAFFHVPGRRAEIIDAFECQECGELVPTDTWQRYLATGDIVVRRPERKSAR